MSDMDPELDMPKEWEGEDMVTDMGGRFEYVVETEEGPSYDETDANELRSPAARPRRVEVDDPATCWGSICCCLAWTQGRQRPTTRNSPPAWPCPSFVCDVGARDPFRVCVPFGPLPLRPSCHVKSFSGEGEALEGCPASTWTAKGGHPCRTGAQLPRGMCAHQERDERATA